VSVLKHSKALTEWFSAAYWPRAKHLFRWFEKSGQLRHLVRAKIESAFETLEGHRC